MNAHHADTTAVVIEATAPPTARAVRAHEIKNCIAVAHAVNQLVANSVDARARERLARSQAALKRILYLVQQDVLPEDEAAEGSALFRSVPVEELMRAVVDRVMDRAEAGGVALVVDCGPGCVEGDLTALVDGLGNLVLNAIEATPPGGVVMLSTRRTPDGCQSWTVQDTGTGMTPETVARLGRRTTGRRGGWGLGFAVARRTMEEHGGIVHVESTPGSGTVVSIWLPAPATRDASRRPLRAVASEQCTP